MSLNSEKPASAKKASPYSGFTFGAFHARWRFGIGSLLIFIAIVAISVLVFQNQIRNQMVYYSLPDDLRTQLARQDLRISVSSLDSQVGDFVVLENPRSLHIQTFELQSYAYFQVMTDGVGVDPKIIYHVPGIDLLANVEGSYGTEGILVWFPQLKEFGSHDPDHGIIHMFGETTWKDIVADPSTYMNAQWWPNRVKNGYYLRPWSDKRELKFLERQQLNE